MNLTKVYREQHSISVSEITKGIQLKVSDIPTGHTRSNPSQEHIPAGTIVTVYAIESCNQMCLHNCCGKFIRAKIKDSDHTVSTCYRNLCTLNNRLVVPDIIGGNL